MRTRKGTAGVKRPFKECRFPRSANRNFLITERVMEDLIRKNWKHQDRILEEVKQRIARGVRSMCFTSVTGSGKSDVIVQLTEWAVQNLGPVVIYNPRKMLTEQLARNFMEHEIPYGIRSAEFKDQCRLEEAIQISSPQTEDARCFRKVRWQLHKAALVIVDEIHMCSGGVIRKILEHHKEQGAFIVLVTATPIGISDLAEELIIGATN